MKTRRTCWKMTLGPLVVSLALWPGGWWSSLKAGFLTGLPKGGRHVRSAETPFAEALRGARPNLSALLFVRAEAC